MAHIPFHNLIIDVSGWWTLCEDKECKGEEEVFVIFDSDTAYYALIMDGYGFMPIGEPHYYEIRDGYYYSPDDPDDIPCKIILKRNLLQMIYDDGEIMYLKRTKKR